MGRCTDIFDNEGYSFYAKGIYCLLAKFANKKGECWPSTRTLAKLAKISRPTVKKAIDELASGGAVIVNRNKTSSGDNDNNFYILPDLIADEGGKPDYPGGQPDLPQVGNEIDHGGKGDLPGVVNDIDHNYTNITNPINLSNITNINNTSVVQAEKPKKGRSSAPAGKDDKYDAKFEEFWSVYLNKKDKGEAYVKWKARVKEKHSPDDLIRAAQNYMAECDQKKTAVEYIKHAKTFLSDKKPFEYYLVEQVEEPQPTTQPTEEKKATLVVSSVPTTEEAWNEVQRTIDAGIMPCWSHTLVSVIVNKLGYDNLCDMDREAARNAFCELYSKVQRRDT